MLKILATVWFAIFSGVIHKDPNFNIHINSSASSKLIFSRISSSKSLKSISKNLDNSLCNCFQIVVFHAQGIAVSIIEFFIFSQN